MARSQDPDNWWCTLLLVSANLFFLRLRFKSVDFDYSALLSIMSKLYPKEQELTNPRRVRTMPQTPSDLN